MVESEWWQQYEVLSNEVSNAIHSFYSWKNINNYAAANPEVLRLLNHNPAFWNITAHALQTTFVITIGRIFDKNPRSHSVQKLLSEMANHPEYFTKTALGLRKQAGVRVGSLNWLPNFLNEAWEPSRADLKQLWDGINPTIKKYNDIYEPIRNKLFAHKDIGVDSEALLGKSLISDVENILYTLHDTFAAVHSLYWNGRKPLLGMQKYNYEEEIIEATRRVMEGSIVFP